jgi:hypothetical protein
MSAHSDRGRERGEAMTGEDEEMIVWQDTLDEISAGRTSALRCPFCNDGKIEITKRGRATRVSCKKCGKFIEGQIGSQESVDQ